MHRNDDLIEPLHYTWIGPPKGITTSSSSSSSPSPSFGGDIKSIIKMASLCNNPIKFYCLDEHVDHYRDTFATYIGENRVTVVPIEDYIKRKIVESENEVIKLSGEKLLQIKMELLNPEKNQSEIYDRVILKSAFSLFLVANESGYVLDTNVELIQPFEFPTYNIFKSAYWSSNKESWMLYSPYIKNNPQNEAVNNSILELYFSSWDKIRDIMREQLSLPPHQRDPFKIQAHHNQMSGLLIEAITKGHETLEEKRKSLSIDTDWEIIFEKPDNGSGLDLAAIGKLRGIPVNKTYNNSHKSEYECKEMLINNIVEYMHTKASKVDSFEFRQKTVNLLLYYMNSYLDYDNRSPDEKLSKYSDTNYNLYHIFEALKKLDRYALQLTEVFITHKHKEKYAQQLKEAINNAYISVSNQKPPLETLIDNILQKLENDVKSISKKYYKGKNLLFNNRSGLFFAKVNNIFDPPEDKNSDDNDKNSSFKLN